MAPFQSGTFADGRMVCADGLWSGRQPVPLSPAACRGIVNAVLNTGGVLARGHRFGFGSGET